MKSISSRPVSLLLTLGLSAGLAGVSGARHASAQELVLMNARVVDVEGGEVGAPSTVVVRDGVIETVTAPAVPVGMRVVDVRGMYLAPGLVDVHVHIDGEDGARRALRSGVTTARSAGSAHYEDVGMRELVRAGHMEGPEILAAGYHVRPLLADAFYMDHPDLGHLRAAGVRGESAVRSVVRANLSRDVDFVKTNATERAGLPETDPRKQLFSLEELAGMVDEAAARDVPVMAHAHGDGGARAAVEAGVRSIEHGTYLSRETLDLMARRGTFLVPTIAIVADLTVPGGDYDDAVLNVRGRHMLPRVREMARNARAAGVKIVAATDTGYGPESTTRLAHELLELVEEVGMSPLEALRAATTVAAELLGAEERIGRVAPGMEADLVVVERNPLEDIGTLQDVLMVVSDGRIAVRRGDWGDAPPSSR